MKYTQTPWAIVENPTPSISHSIVDNTNTAIINIIDRTRFVHDRDKEQARQETNANANLALAAPDMLEALAYARQAIEAKWNDKMGMHFGNNTGHIKTKVDVLDLIDEALKKAVQ